MLFLFGGKGLVNTFFRARKEVRVYFQYVRKNRQVDALLEELNSTTAVLAELNAEEEYKIKIFISEYQLAFGSRHLDGGLSMKKFA